MKKLAIGIALILVAYYFVSKYMRRDKYIRYFKDIGFGDVFLSKFSTDELYYSYSYVENYARKGIKLTPNVDPDLYEKVKAIDNKFHIFTNLNS